MSFNLRNRSFLTLADFNTREMEYMLNLAEDLKKAKYTGNEVNRLEGKNTVASPNGTVKFWLSTLVCQFGTV